MSRQTALVTDLPWRYSGSESERGQINWIADLLGVGAAADLARRPWRLMTRYLENTGSEELFMGFLYVAWGQKPDVSR
jgi:hypothetical protein